MAHPMDESKDGVLRLDFDRRLNDVGPPQNVPALNHLWTNLKSRKEAEPDGYAKSEDFVFFKYRMKIR